MSVFRSPLFLILLAALAAGGLGGCSAPPQPLRTPIAPTFSFERPTTALGLAAAEPETVRTINPLVAPASSASADGRPKHAALADAPAVARPSVTTDPNTLALAAASPASRRRGAR